MSKPKYNYYSKEELINFVLNNSSIENILKKMGYYQTKDSRIIKAFRKYLDSLNIQNNFLKDYDELIKCNSCGLKKTQEHFYFSKGKLSQRTCKECVQKKQREKYHLKQEEINEFKKNHPCKKCGCSKFYLIEFHHINPEEKEYTIAENTNAKFETLLKEINKCIPLCANCHREFHYLEKEKGITIEQYLNGAVE